MRRVICQGGRTQIGQACREHLIGELAGTRGIEFTAKKSLDLSRLGIELLGQVAHIVTVPRELWFQIVESTREHRFDGIRAATARKAGGQDATLQ